MRIDRFKKFLLLFLALASILACGPFTSATPQPAATLNALYTAAAQTLEGMSTQAANTLIAQPTATATLSIPTASPTTFNTFTSVPPIVTVAARCDSASFEGDVTYPDGSIVGRSTPFKKTWRIKNTGTCTWTTSYSIVYVSGEKFGAKNAYPMPESVSPGETVTISIDLIAPDSNGDYRGDWKLRNASGVIFGLGSGNSSFYVDVTVKGYTVTGYDFAANYCDAAWENNTRSLPCPGADGENRGFVMLLNSVKLEDGKARDNVLLTHPKRSDDGLIRGVYPAINIKSGDSFQALIGCQHKANDCDVYFRLEYQIGNGTIRTLGQWREVYEGQYYPVNIDLSSLSGEKVKFIFTVFANGSGHEDYALWVAPRIMRQSSQAPTATITSTPSPTATATATFTATATATATETPTETATATP